MCKPLPQFPFSSEVLRFEIFLGVLCMCLDCRARLILEQRWGGYNERTWRNLKRSKFDLLNFFWKIWKSWRYRNSGIAEKHLSENSHSAEVSRVPPEDLSSFSFWWPCGEVQTANIDRNFWGPAHLCSGTLRTVESTPAHLCGQISSVEYDTNFYSGWCNNELESPP